MAPDYVPLVLPINSSVPDPIAFLLHFLSQCYRAEKQLIMYDTSNLSSEP